MVKQRSSLNSGSTAVKQRRRRPSAGPVEQGFLGADEDGVGTVMMMMVVVMVVVVAAVVIMIMIRGRCGLNAPAFAPAGGARRV